MSATSEVFILKSVEDEGRLQATCHVFSISVRVPCREVEGAA